MEVAGFSGVQVRCNGFIYVSGTDRSGVSQDAPGAARHLEHKPVIFSLPTPVQPGLRKGQVEGIPLKL
jgi:hypothetical protein